MKPYLYFFPFILLIYSCNDTKREGLHESQRNYSKITKELPSYFLNPSDLMIRMKNADRNDIFTSVLLLTDSVFGTGFEAELKRSDLKGELEEYLYHKLAKFDNKQVQLDQRDLRFLSQSYFESDSITGFTNYDKFIGFNNHKFKYEIRIGDYKLVYELESILSPKWKRVGTFKRKFDDGERKDIMALFAYEHTLTVVINLKANNLRTNKTEYYQKLFNDQCVAYTVMNYTDAEALNDR